MATRDGLAQIWYADANGVVTGYTPNADNVASAIIDAYNEHFGTDIGIWTPETKSLQVGDTVPNWNAYEKIEMPPAIYVKTTPQGSNLYTIGKIVENSFSILCQDENGAWQIDGTGKVNGVFGHPADLISYVWASKLQSAGYDITTSGIENISLNVGDTIENWEDYIEIA